MENLNNEQQNSMDVLTMQNASYIKRHLPYITLLAKKTRTLQNKKMAEKDLIILLMGLGDKVNESAQDLELLGREVLAGANNL